MSQNAEILLEGSYLYYQKEVNYSQENFKLVHMPEQQSFHVYAEILSRIETGEFLKILVRYEMNQHYIPTFVRIEKSIGNRYAQEAYKLDVPNLELQYSFQNSQNTQEFSRNISAKHYLTSPAVSTAGMFTLSKKFDATGRSPVVLLSSDNDWTYVSPPTEKIVYAEFRTREMQDYKLNNSPLSASHLCLYEFDTSNAGAEQPVNIYLSKHYAIPYELVHGDQRIVIKNLKKNI
ncbi:hypothetical protein ACJVC5_09135 [Peredibacter sp. HCB2-198]|uniref:hypothetical protein n=1 Tax=Peredibacter sp. HCB2-198 TaxID=3383025 RepID=UPI0038B51166